MLALVPPVSHHLAPRVPWAPSLDKAAVEYTRALVDTKARQAQHYSSNTSQAREAPLLTNQPILLRPIHSIPTELLQEIFLHWVSAEHSIAADTRAMPMSLTHVCALWRTVALNTPRLWTSLSLRGQPIQQLWNESLSHWISYSGQLDLSLTLDCLRPDDGVVELLQNILPLIAHRWQTLDFNIAHNFLQIFLAIPSTSLPSLDSLAIRNISLLDRRTGINPLEAGIWHAPRLRKLMLINVEIDDRCLSILPLKNLTQLVLLPEATERVEGFGVQAALTLLSHATSLKWCTIALEDAAFNNTCSQAIVTVPRLQELQIQLRTIGVPLHRLFDDVRAPELRRLSWSSCADGRLLRAALKGMLGRSSRVTAQQDMRCANNMWETELISVKT